MPYRLYLYELRRLDPPGHWIYFFL